MWLSSGFLLWDWKDGDSWGLEGAGSGCRFWDVNRRGWHTQHCMCLASGGILRIVKGREKVLSQPQANHKSPSPESAPRAGCVRERLPASVPLPAAMCGWRLCLASWATTVCHQLLFSDLSEQRRNFTWPEKLTEQFTFRGNVIFSDKELMLVFLANSLKAFLSVAFLDVISWRKHPWPWLNKTGHLFHGVAVSRNVNKWQLKDDIK